MIQAFSRYSKKVLVIDEKYTSWLIDYYRRQNQGLLATGYFRLTSSDLNTMDQKRNFLGFYNFLASVERK